MRRGATPVMHLHVVGIDLTQMQKINIIIAQADGYVIFKDDDDIDILRDNHMDIFLSQMESLKLKTGAALIQLKAKSYNDHVYVSNTESISIGPLIDDGVM